MDGGGFVAMALVTFLARSMELELIEAMPNVSLEGTSPKLPLDLLFSSFSLCNGGHEVESLSKSLCIYKYGLIGNGVYKYKAYYVSYCFHIT